VWQDFGAAICLVLVIEGIVPFLYPRRWKEMVATIAELDDSTMRIAGFVSMVAGTGMLVVIRST